MSGYKEFLNLIIEDGILEAKKKHARSDDVCIGQLRGKTAGFDACRDRFPHQIVAILEENKQDLVTDHKDWELRPDRFAEVAYRRDLCKVEAIEWVLQVLGAALGQRFGITITKQAFEKAEELDLRANSKRVDGVTAPPSLEMR